MPNDAAARILRPAPFGRLFLQQITPALFREWRVLFTQKRQQEQEFAFQNGVALKLGNPKSIGVLLADEPLLCAKNRLPQGAGGIERRMTIGPIECPWQIGP